MKRLTVLIFLLFLSKITFSQENIITDSLLNQMCSYLIQPTDENDSARIESMYQRYFYSLKIEKNYTETADYLYFQLQKKCPEFKKILHSMGKITIWKFVEQLPNTKITSLEFERFLKAKRIYYFESDGDTVSVTLKRAKWDEKFSDGTSSVLTFVKKSAGEFDLVFESSTNHIRKNYSKAGDQYKYIIYAVEGNKYFFATYSDKGRGYSVSYFVID